MRVIFFVLIAVFMTNCSSDGNYVRRHQWKYGDGYHIGDWLSFDNPNFFALRHDTLFKQDTATAMLVHVDKQFGRDVELTIKSLKTGESGIYHKK